MIHKNNPPLLRPWKSWICLAMPGFSYCPCFFVFENHLGRLFLEDQLRWDSYAKKKRTYGSFSRPEGIPKSPWGVFRTKSWSSMMTLRQGGSSKTREWWWLGYDQKLPVPMEKSFEWVCLKLGDSVGKTTP